MSLARALAALPSDGEVEATVEDVVVLFSHHPGEWIDAHDVAKRVARPVVQTEPVLKALAQAFVLDFDGSSSYRYQYDIGVSVEIEQFLHRARAQKNHVQNNVARFRERYGSF
ncbi:MAG: hypothetical protein ABFC80_03405 [Coriobacteriales bacterium]|nr:hypothetical protein [Actinomycetes bacterium]